MKNHVKIPAAIIATLLLVSIPMLAIAAGSNNGQTDRDKPVKAENVELVKKVTLKGGAAKPVQKTTKASTGIVGAELTGNRYAIVIGINDYPGSDSDLQYAVNDATEVKNVLINQYSFNPDNITLLTDKLATRQAIRDAVNALKYDPIKKLTADDELVFFFSGHGAKGKAADGDKNSVDQSIVVCNDDYTDFYFMWDGELKELFSDFPTNRIVFIFDSCLSGGMSVLGGTGRVVNMACTANGLSYESSDWGDGNGQFTYLFAIKGMGDKAAESADPDSLVTVEEAFDYTKANCQFQSPTISDRFTNDLLP